METRSSAGRDPRNRSAAKLGLAAAVRLSDGEAVARVLPRALELAADDPEVLALREEAVGKGLWPEE